MPVGARWASSFQDGKGHRRGVAGRAQDTDHGIQRVDLRLCPKPIPHVNCPKGFDICRLKKATGAHFKVALQNRSYDFQDVEQAHAG